MDNEAMKQLEQFMSNASPEAVAIKDAFAQVVQAKDHSQKTLAFIGLLGTLKKLKGEGANATANQSLPV